jgi:hypothetical protein
VNTHALNALRAKACKSELVFQSAELAFHGGAAAVQRAPLIRLSSDARVVSSALLDSAVSRSHGLDRCAVRSFDPSPQGRHWRINSFQFKHRLFADRNQQRQDPKYTLILLIFFQP